MDYKIGEIAERIKGLRQMLGKSLDQLAKVTASSVAEYRDVEAGRSDFNFTFLYNVACELGVDITELITGEAPHLVTYTVERAGEGMPIERRKGFNYLHKAAFFKGRTAEPFVVTAPFSSAEQSKAITESTHSGQEFDLVLKGSLKVSVDGHIEILREGDSIYYNSKKPHGMIATDGAECKFLAIVFDK